MKSEAAPVSAINRVVFKSTSDRWATPRAIYDALHCEFSFNFDPCPIDGTVDGLSPLFADWSGTRARISLADALDERLAINETTMTQTLNPPLKWHGGKTYLADRLIALFPPHIHYVEPFFGGGAVLLAKNPIGVSEVVNDLNGELINFWRVLADPILFPMFLRTAQATPCSEKLFEEAQRAAKSGDAVCRAIRFFILCRQSRAATFKDFTTLAKTRTRRKMNELPSAWWNAIDGLPEVHARLSRVVILNRPAVDCMFTQDAEGTLFYCDPPYMHETRSTPNVYQHEMSRQDHEEFLDACLACKGYVVISGYDCDLYRDRLAKWQRHAFELPNNAAGGDSKRRMTEVVWCNYAAGGVR